MKCPRTGEPMITRNVGGVEVEISPACGGVWFDRFELQKVDEAHEEVGDMLVEHLDTYHRTLEPTAPRLKCPRDTDVVMMRRYFSPKRQIEIDECPACGGVWLDAEELAGLRSLFRSVEERQAARESFAREILSSPEAQEHRAEFESLIDKLEGVRVALWRVADPSRTRKR